MKDLKKGIIYAIISAICFGIMPIFAIKAYSYGISVYTLLVLRFSISSLLFFLFLLWKKIPFKIGKMDLKLLFLLGGVLFTLLSVLHFESLKYLSSAMAVLLLFSFPIFVSIFSFLIYKEKLKIKSIIALFFTFISMIFLLGVSFQGINMKGVFLAILAAIVYALYMILGKKVTDNNSPVVTSTYVTSFAALGVLFIGLITRELHWNFASNAWIYIFSIVLVSTIIGEITLFKSLQILNSTNVSMISMVEPIFTSIFGLLFLQEVMQPPQLLGGFFILIGLTFLIYFQNKN
ncbi:hypothetical protein C3943_21950 [Lysinibacillus sp. B2A1]|nr:hypothetical protein C3943_21950 [Lysinibacillus sp. B2A1]